MTTRTDKAKPSRLMSEMLALAGEMLVNGTMNDADYAKIMMLAVKPRRSHL